MSGTLQLSAGPGGLRAGPFLATLGTTLAIGDTEPVTIALNGQIPDGPWEARVTLESGLLQRSAQAIITFPKIGASLPVTTTSSRSSWFLFLVMSLVVLLLLSVALLLVTLRRVRRRARITPSGDVEVNRCSQGKSTVSPHSAGAGSMTAPVADLAST
jgi:hypothetical protein